MKEKIWKRLGCLSRYDFEGELTKIIQKLQDLQTEYPTKRLRLEVDDNWDNSSFGIQSEELETDEEYSTRITKEKEKEKRIEEYELKKLRELKEKYEVKQDGM